MSRFKGRRGFSPDGAKSTESLFSWHNDQHSQGLDQRLFLLPVVNASTRYTSDAFCNIGISILLQFSK